MQEVASPASAPEQHCLVCYSVLSYTGIVPCGHNHVCGTCHLRLRHLHSDKKCPMCKVENEQLIVDELSLNKEFDDYPMWGNELGAGFVHRSDVGMFFPTEYYEREILPLFSYDCNEPNCKFNGATPDVNIYQQAQEKMGKQQQRKKNTPVTPLRGLQDHLRNKHRLTLCQLCVDHRRDFVHLLPRFTPNQLKKHSSKGDGAGSGFKGHPLCEFCRPKRFYDLTLLYTHLQKDHYKCHICDKQGLPNQYFRDYTMLAKHFERQHFLCPDPQCLAARFVVFENEIDFRAHEQSTHGISSAQSSTKIQLEFRIRRAGHDGSGYEEQDVPTDQDFSYGLDGQAFVPEPLNRNDNEERLESSHPLHLQRTAELRAHAEQLRRERDDMESAPDNFPSLADQTQHNSGSNLRMGWTSEPGTSVMERLTGNAKMKNTEENFPALPAAAAGKKKKAAAALSKSSAAPSGGRTFAAMRGAAMAPAPAVAPSSASWRGGGAAARAPPDYPGLSSSSYATPGASLNREADLTADNFPSLGGTSSARYPAAERVARKQQSKAPPALNNASHFPPPPTASNKASVREQMMGQQKPKAPSQAALNNMMNFPPPMASSSSAAQGKATVEEMKASLGSKRYKELKNITREFASDALSPEAYVDHAASLFDSGYADRDFWSYLPSLLASCPNASSAQQATRYMEQLRRSQYSENLSAKPAAPAAAAGGGWSAPPKVPAAVAAPPQMTSSQKSSGGWTGAASSYSRPAGNLTPFSSSRQFATGSGKKSSSAWAGTSSTSAVARAKAPPGSVAGYVEGPQTGTATKYMAKASKQKSQQQQQHQNQNSNSSKNAGKKKNKKKEKDELRALAFGK